MKPVESIQVSIWGEIVGATAFDPQQGAFAFEYAPAWEAKAIELAPFTMPVRGHKHQVYSFPNLPRETFHGLPGLLADALPDRFGNALIDAWMAERGISPDSITALDRLAYMAGRGLGALEFKPSRGATRESSAALQMSSLVEAARLAVSGSCADEPKTRAALREIIRVGTSAGGARAKAVVAFNPATQELRCGQFAVPTGFEHWLLKFDGLGPDHDLGGGKEYGRIEYAYHLMARRAGIEMAPCRLLEENGRAHFMTRRFDRTGQTRHHLQSLCGMLHLDFNRRETHSYAQLFQAIHALQLGDPALAEAFRRMAFNVMARNCDDHTKNFSFILRQNQPWALAPAYDLTHAHNPRSLWTRQHLMSVNQKFDQITRDDLIAVGDRYRVPDSRRLVAEVAVAIKQWPEFAREAGLNHPAAAAIQNDFCVL